MLVKALRLGFYGVSRKREGDMFKLKDPKHFSSEWMEKVDEDEFETPKKKPRKIKDEVPSDDII